MKVTSTRYFETRRGLGYECTTNVKGISIWNDGQGGGTYLNNDNMNDEFHHLTEDQLERLIDKYELNKKYIMKRPLTATNWGITATDFEQMNQQKMIWNDPDPIDGNDYTIQKIWNINKETAMIQYGEKNSKYLSEAEVYLTEIIITK
jgi:hypothetical protein